MKKYEPIYKENYTSYFPDAEGSIVLKIFLVMLDMFYIWIATECAGTGAFVLCGVVLVFAVAVTVVLLVLAVWMENENITVSYDGVVFKNTYTGKTKEFAWKDVASVEYVGNDHYKKGTGYKIYLKKSGIETRSSKKHDYFIPDNNVNRHKIEAFIPCGLSAV